MRRAAEPAQEEKSMKRRAWLSLVALALVGAVALAANPPGYGPKGGTCTSTTNTEFGGPYGPEKNSPPQIEYPLGSGQVWTRVGDGGTDPLKFTRELGGGIMTLIFSGSTYRVINKTGSQVVEVDRGSACKNP